jgi:tetratricopeptide (TPR) repeat protein
MKPQQLSSLALATGLTLALVRSAVGFAEELPRLEETQREALTSHKRDETIEQLKRIIPKIDDPSAQKADLLYQLSELYVEKSKELLHSEMANYDAQYKSYERANKRGARQSAPQADHRDSEAYRAEAIALYQRVLREYPGYQRRDEILFALGYNLYEIGRRSDAVASYLELIRAYPNSSFVPDTFLQLGNHYFDVDNDLQQARHFYQQALGNKIPKVHSYALYKLAWCDYNAGDFEGALKKLQQVVDFAQTRGREMVDLKNEALSDLTAVYVRVGRSDEAIQYFERTASENQQRKLIARLATQLADAGQYNKAIRAYRYLISRAPMHPDAPEYQQAIVRCYEGLRDRSHVKSEIRRLVDLYRPGGEWWTVNQNRKDFLRNAFSVSEEAMRTLAVDYHQEAQRTKQVETYRLARDIYAQYADAFAKSSDPSFVSDQALNMLFYYAEVLWALADWENAAKQYDRVIDFKVPDRESAREVSGEKLRKSAAYSAVLSYDQLVKIDRGELAKSDLKSGPIRNSDEKTRLDWGRIERRSAKGGAEEPLTEHEQKLVAACDRYNHLYPGDQDEVGLRYLAATIYYQRQHFFEAAARFEQIAENWPDDRQSEQAADLAMYILETAEDWPQLNRLARQFLANARLAKPGSEFAKRVANVVAGSQYKQIDEIIYRKEKNPAKAGQEFIRFADEFPKSEYAAKALTYAMIAFGEAHQLDAGMAAGQRVLSNYRASPFELKVRYTLAHYYEKLADFARAASMYESFVAAYDRRAAEAGLEKGVRASPKHRSQSTKTAALGESKGPDERLQLLEEAEKWIPDAQFDAGLWWDALGRNDKASLAYRGYLARFKDAKDAPEVKYTLGSLYEKSKKWSEAIKIYREFETEYAKDKRVNSAQRFLVKHRRMIALRALGNRRESEQLLEELMHDYARLRADIKTRDDVQEAYAGVRFERVEPLWQQYVQLKFTRVTTIKGDLVGKQRKLKELEKAYTQVLGIGVADYGIAALTRIGLAYADLAQNIVGSPNPRGLTREQLQLYRGELRNLASPIETKAVEVLEKAVLKANELGVYNEWTLTAQNAINKFQPGAYPKARELPYRGSNTLAAAPLQKDTAAIAQASPRAPQLSASEGR